MKTLGVDTGAGTLGWAIYDSEADKVDKFGYFTQPNEKQGGVNLDQRVVRAAQFICDTLLPKFPDAALPFDRVAVEAALSYGRTEDYMAHVLCWIIRCRAALLNVPAVEVYRSSVYCCVSGTAKTTKQQMYELLNGRYAAGRLTCHDESDAIAVAIAGTPVELRPACYVQNKKAAKKTKKAAQK